MDSLQNFVKAKVTKIVMVLGRVWDLKPFVSATVITKIRSLGGLPATVEIVVIITGLIWRYVRMTTEKLSNSRIIKVCSKPNSRNNTYWHYLRCYKEELLHHHNLDENYRLQLENGGK